MVSLVGGIFSAGIDVAAMCLRPAIASWKAIPAASQQQRRAIVRSAGTEQP
jgi:hypothetical protein